MADLLVAPDAESLCIEVLNEGLGAIGEVSTVKASSKIPTRGGKTLTEFIRIYQLGAQSDTIITDQVRMQLEAWADTETRARRIWSLSCAVMLAETDRFFSATNLSGPINNPHPDYPKLARYYGQILLRVSTRPFAA